MTSPVVGVVPPSAFAQRRHLFEVLSRALDIRFTDACSDNPRLSATVYIEEEPERVHEPSLVLKTGHGPPVVGTGVRFSRSSEVDGHLRGWIIKDEAILGTSSLDDSRDITVLADVSGRPVWTTRTDAGIRVDHAALAPVGLGSDATLQSLLVPGRFFGLLPLVSFLRSLDRRDRWNLPPVRASFMMDDPNLHATTYGYIDYEKVAREASDNRFHLSVATIPLDGWFVRADAAKVFNAHPDELSLVIHGNNHTKHELGVVDSRIPRLQVLAQGLRRIQRFEQRSGIPVARVMAVPHGRCSEESASAMARLGFESMCVSRSFPWLDRPPASHPLAGWYPADTSSVVPTVARIPLSGQPERIALRAFLGQPIVLYGHESDLGRMPDLFTTWAERVARLKDVSWASVGDISRGLVTWRSDGETLWVRPHTGLVEVAAPQGIERIVIEADDFGDAAVTVTDASRGSARVSVTDGRGEAPVSQGASNLTIRIRPERDVDAEDVPVPRWSPWPLTRRLLTEARDRSRPRIDALRRR